jgi:hypothetical protein
MTQQYEGMAPEMAEIVATASKHVSEHSKSEHAHVSLTGDASTVRRMTCSACDWRSAAVFPGMNRRAECTQLFTALNADGPQMACTKPLFHQGKHAATVVLDEA